MFRFDCTFSNFNCTKRVQLHTILRPGVDDDGADMKILRRVDARILRRRCRDDDPTTTMLTRWFCDDVDVERSIVVVGWSLITAVDCLTNFDYSLPSTVRLTSTTELSSTSEHWLRTSRLRRSDNLQFAAVVGLTELSVCTTYPVYLEDWLTWSNLQLPRLNSQFIHRWNCLNHFDSILPTTVW